MILLSSEQLQMMRAHAEKDYPAECCGLLTASQTAPARTVDVIPMVNAQDEYHARYPDEFPRTARNGYFLEPRALLAFEKKMRADSKNLLAVYHSHIDAGAYFSNEDKRAALSGGEPLYPGIFYFVISVLKGKAAEYRIFSWDKQLKDFTENGKGDFLSNSPFPVQ